MLLVSVFGGAKEAVAGADVLQDLHAAGSLSLYTFAIVSRESTGGGVCVRQPLGSHVAAAAPAAGATVGALVSLMGGPATAAMRTLASGVVEAMRDLVDAGLSLAFLEQVGEVLRPGRAGVVAEAELDGLMTVEMRILALGGRMLLQADGGAKPDDLIIGEIEALRRSLARLRTEAGGLDDPAVVRAILRSRAEELHCALARARLLAQALRREGVAKVAMLRAQAAVMDGEVRAIVEGRAGRVRTALEARALRVGRAAEEGAWAAT